MKWLRRNPGRRILIAALFTLLPSGGTVAEPDPEIEAAENFFRRATITYLVPGKPGGGYDTYARLITRHMARQLSGTRILVRNTPGAGGMLVANQLNSARPDGLTIGSINAGLVYSQLLKNPALRFDLRDLSWIGKGASETRVLVTGRHSRFRSLEDLRAPGPPALLGASGIGSGSYNETLLLTGLLQLNARIIPGFSGNRSDLALRRGDIDGRMHSYSSIRDTVAAGDANIILRVSGSRLPLDAPEARDLVHDGTAAAFFALMDTVNELGRSTAGPPGMAPGRLAVLRQAYTATLQDPEFLRDAAALALPVSPGTGEEVATRLARLFAAMAPREQMLRETMGYPR